VILYPLPIRTKVILFLYHNIFISNKVLEITSKRQRAKDTEMPNSNGYLNAQQQQEFKQAPSSSPYHHLKKSSITI
jgi:hypothetical protein